MSIGKIILGKNVVGKNVIRKKHQSRLRKTFRSNTKSYDYKFYCNLKESLLVRCHSTFLTNCMPHAIQSLGTKLKPFFWKKAAVFF